MLAPCCSWTLNAICITVALSFLFMTIGVHRGGKNCLLNHDHLFLMTCGSFDLDLDFDARYKGCTPTGPNLGCSVRGQGGALDVSGAAWDLCLNVFCCLILTVSRAKLFQSMVVLGKRVSVDSSFCGPCSRILRVVSCVVYHNIISCLEVLGLGLWSVIDRYWCQKIICRDCRC